MTFKQLVLKNLWTNSPRYLAYFLCVLFAMTVFFLFSSIWFTPDFTQLTTAGMRQIVIIGWAVTVLFSFLMIGYAHNQFAKARSREFGILLSYGLLHKDIKKMVIIENVIIYLTALACAFVTGGIFSRLFCLLTTGILAIENIEFSLTISSFLLTALSFLPVFTMVVVLTLIKTRGTVTSLIKDDKKQEMKAGKVSAGLMGIGLSIFAMVALYFYTSDPANTLNMQRATLLAIISCLVGLYFFVNNLGTVLYSFVKGKKSVYLRNLLNISQFSHRYLQNRRVIYILCILSLGAVMFTSLSYTLFTQTYWVVEREQLHDVLIRDFDSLDILEEVDLDGILAGSQSEVTDHQTLQVVYLQAPQILNDPWRPIKWVPITSVENYNQVFAAQYAVEIGGAITIVYNRLDDYRDFFTEDIILEDDTSSYSFRQRSSQHVKIFNRYAFAQPVLILLSEADFSNLYTASQTENRGSLHLVNFANWLDAKDTVSTLDEELTQVHSTFSQTHPQEVELLQRRHPHAFSVTSKAERYDHNRQVGGFALFIMTFISLLFLVAICIMIYFKILSDHDEDSKTIATLTTVGITNRQIRQYLSGKLKLLMAPMLLGSLMAIGLSLALNLRNIVEMEISNPTIFLNLLLVTGVFAAAMLAYYQFLRLSYFRRHQC